MFCFQREKRILSSGSLREPRIEGRFSLPIFTLRYALRATQDEKSANVNRT